MDKDDCCAAVEFLPKRGEVGVAEVAAVVGCEEGDAVGVEGVERVTRFFDGEVDVVRV